MISGGAGFHGLRRGRESPPDNTDGVLEPDHDGGLDRTWAGLWARAHPGTEPAIQGVRHTYRATVPVVSRGGDIDKRDGAEPIAGIPWSIEVPAGLCALSAIWFHVYLPETNYTPATAWSSSEEAACSDILTMTPQVGAGGYGLESTADGYDRDWSMVSFLVSLSAEGTPGHGDSDDVTETIVVVPEGALATVETLRLGSREAIDVGLGTWDIRFSSTDGLRVHPAAAP